MKKFSEGRRRLHLDFHNPAGIPDLAVDFDAKEFAFTLIEAGFDSATVFAQDAHGLSYFPTKIGIPHPSLPRDLLGEMITECHAQEIAAGAYISAGCSDYAKSEWYQVTQDGKPRSFEEQGGYSLVCLNSDYVTKNVLPITAELLENYSMDALWYDLLFFWDEGCHCPVCLDLMRESGLNPASPSDIREHMRRSIGRFIDKVAELTYSLRPEIEMTFNGLSIHERPLGLEKSAYVDIEALATGGWGYYYFPSKARYLRTLGKPVMGMTSAFHRSWGDFGTVKSRALLEYECYTFLAAGSLVAIGDQMPPRGRLEKARYHRIGEVLHSIRDLDPWLENARPLAEAAIVLSPLAQGQFPSDSWIGACKVLMEAKVQFDVVDCISDWDKYQLLLCPDNAYSTESVKTKLADYLSRGGAVLCSGDAISALPSKIVRKTGEGSSEPAYLKTCGNWAGDIPDLPHLVSSGFLEIEAGKNNVLATLVKPYPKTDPQFYYSSPQIPYARETDYPVIIQKDRCVYFAARIFQEYSREGYGLHRQLLISAIQKLLPDPLVCGNLPLSFEQALFRQEERLICLLVPYAPMRGEHIAQIEEWPSYADLSIGVRGSFEKAYRAPSGEALECRYEDSYTVISLACSKGPSAIVFE